MNHVFSGEVIKGAQRGRKLGFPTANIQLFEKIPSGIYISRTVIDNKTYNSITFIGNATTYNETDFKAEIHILNFHKNLYNKDLETILLKKIRENEKFESEEKLMEQIEVDVKMAKKYFSNSTEE